VQRKLNIDDKEEFNQWIFKSLNLAESTSYLDDILEIYPFQSATPERLPDKVRNQIIRAHQSRNTDDLIVLLKGLTKFPYEDPVWYMLKNIKGFFDNNPQQLQRIAQSIYAMTAEETVIRLESAPKLNTQIGPMFNNWVKNKFTILNLNDFKKSSEGIVVLGESENIGQSFISEYLNQDLPKRPDLIAKVNNQYVIGEAKWIGQSGGNQEKQVQEVLSFCANQRGNILRIGIVDGFPWSIYRENGRIINDKVVVNIQESNYDIISALLIEEYLQQYL